MIRSNPDQCKVQIPYFSLFIRQVAAVMYGNCSALRSKSTEWKLLQSTDGIRQKKAGGIESAVFFSKKWDSKASK